jgi:hypothetical protein
MEKELASLHDEEVVYNLNEEMPKEEDLDEDEDDDEEEEDTEDDTDDLES